MTLNHDFINSAVILGLKSINLSEIKINKIINGAPIYGENGLLDSIHLVSFMASIAESIEEHIGSKTDLFSFIDGDALLHLKNINTLTSYLSNVHDNA